MADLRIDIASEFVGRKAFNDANKSVNSLDKAVGKLGKQLASVFAAQKVYSFAKSTVQAFAEDQKSAALLTNTVKNLGLAFAQPQIDDYIQNLEKASGVVDDELRPAMQKLLTTTGSVAKSQELLTQAVDISRASGVDLATVSQDLANAYVGNTKGLKKYALGLTQAELKAMSFTKIQKKLADQFSGSNAAYLDTFAGKMSVLNVAADNAKETIGKGLVDAFDQLTGKTSDVQNLANALQGVADEVAAISVGLAGVINSITNTPLFKVASKLIGSGIKEELKASGAKSIFGALTNKKTPATGASTIENYQMSSQARANAKARAAAEAAAAKRAKELAKAQTSQTKALQAQAALKKAQGVFDLQQIELVAALQGKLSEQDRIRAEAQLALLNDNSALATKLTNQIIAAQDPTGKLGQMLKDLGNTTIADPFSEWLKTLVAINDQLTKITSPTQTIPGITQTPGMALIDQMPATGGSIFDNYTPPSYSYGDFRKAESASQPIVLQLDGQTIATSLANYSANGTSSFIDRNLGSFVV